MELTGLNDCYKYDRKKKNFRLKELTFNGQLIKKGHINRLKLNHCSDESSDEELITCGHKENTFTKPFVITPKSSKRIDFILYKLRDFCFNDNNCGSRTEVSTLISCYPESMKITAKDVSGLSYSDHQPVAAKLNFVSYMKPCVESDEEKNTNSDSNQLSNEGSDEVDSSINSCNNNESKSSKNLNDTKMDTKIKKMGKLKQKDEHSKTSQWKPIANKKSHQFSKLNNSFLHDIEHLLSDYVKANTPFKHILYVCLVLVAISILLILEYLSDLSMVVVILSFVICMILSIVGFILGFILHRHEVNAIKAILSDINKKRTFPTDYDLLESE